MTDGPTITELQMPKTTLFGLLMFVSALSAQAQTAKPDATEAAAAMERAQRIAANPMRMILQAGKVNRKTSAEESTAVAQVAPTRPLTQVAFATTTATTAPSPAAPVAPAATEPVASPRPAPPPPPVYNTMARMDGPVGGESAALPGVSQALAVTEQLATASPSAALMSNVITPKIKRMVEPTFPASVQDELSRVREVTVKFNIAADGTVSEVVMQQPAPRQLARYVQSAVSQWLFEPLPAARSHSVQLVFNDQ
jgi:hypothetical protein